MNPLQCRIVLRPRGPFEVLDLGVRFARERWRPLAWLAVWVVLPPAVLCTFAAWWLEGHWATLALPVAFAPAVQAPYTRMVGRLLFDEHVGVGEVLRDVLTAAPALVLGWLLVGVAMLGFGGLTCGYGVPMVQGALLYQSETALLERSDVVKGANRSLRLASSGATQVLAGVFVRWALLGWFALAGEAVGQALVGFVLQLGEPFGTLSTGWVTPYVLVGLLVANVAWAIFRVLLYIDVRTRSEGWDLWIGLRAAAAAR